MRKPARGSFNFSAGLVADLRALVDAGEAGRTMLSRRPDLLCPACSEGMVAGTTAYADGAQLMFVRCECGFSSLRFLPKPVERAE